MKKLDLRQTSCAGSVLAILALATLATVPASAVPFHEPVVNGVITGDGTDWDPADLVVDDVADDNLSYTINVRRLWCTWDAENLYLGVTYQDYGGQESLAIYLDLDRDVGPNSAANLETFAGNFEMPTGHRFELVLGRAASEEFPGTAPTVHLVTNSEGAMTDISGSTLTAQGYTIEVKTAARLLQWLNAEFAIPWDEIYPDQDGTVPPWAVIKAVAVAAGPVDDLIRIDAAPSNDGDTDVSETVALANLHASVIDADGDGEPDRADGTVSGTASLPGDDGTAELTITAEMVASEFGGRDPGAPLSVVTTSPGVREYTLPRLPAGRYEVTLEAEGFFPTTYTIDVGESEAVTAPDQTLPQATAIRGQIGFASGPGAVGTAVLTDGAGLEMDHFDFTAAGDSYVFYVLSSGSYTITVDADTYLPTETTVAVTTGVEVTGVDFLLKRETEIAGTVSFGGGTVIPGTLYLLDSSGEVLDSESFHELDLNFQFFTPVSGTFTLTASVGTYLPTEMTFPVTAGQDITDLVVVLVRETMISGTVSFESGPGFDGTLQLLDETDEELDSSDFPAGGGPFEFFTPVGGQFTLRATADTYVTTDSTFTVIAGQDVTGFDLVLPRAALLSGAIIFEGPATPGYVVISALGGDAPADTLDFALQSELFSKYLQPGDYRLVASASGYLPYERIVSVGLADLDLGPLELIAVRATRLLLVDENEEEIPEVRGTYSTPDSNLWFFAPVNLLAVDEDGRIDRFDLDGNLNGFRLTARKLNDTTAPRGDVVFYASADLEDVSTIVDFHNGRARFWMTDDELEMLRIYLAQPEKDPIAGRIAVAFLEPKPTVVVLTADKETLTADGEEVVTVTASLFDAARNPSRIPGVSVTFLVAENSSGKGLFEEAGRITNSYGEATASLVATGSGVLNISCSVVIGNADPLAVLAYDLDSEEELLPITAEPGSAAGWDLILPGVLSPYSAPLSLTAQLVDAYGNSVPQAGVTVNFTADDANLGQFGTATAITDPNGRAVGVFNPAGSAGLIMFTADGSSFAEASANLQLADIFLFQDPPWYDEPVEHQTFAETDLTTVVIDNTANELVLDIPFSTSFGEMQLHVLLETKFDAAGATLDPFEQPVAYGHTLLPDYALTAKFFGDEYADFRAWSNSTWRWWNPASGELQDSGADIHGSWTTRTSTGMNIRIPWAPFDKLSGRPDSVLVQVYITQDERTDDPDKHVKRSAFDSVPSDATLNLDFDPDAPEPGDWANTEETVTLSNWSPTYVVKTDFATPPEVTDVKVEPAAPTAGDLITLTAAITDAGDGVGDVLADLSGMGGGSLVRMRDDGNASHGDATADDGIYSLSVIVPVDNPGGAQTLAVNAYDASNSSVAEGTTEIDVTAILEPILDVPDPIGDDHGPNRPGVRGKYYTYPTNLAFPTGCFDITNLTVFEMRQIVDGQPVEMIAFQVSLVDFPDPADQGTADWNPDFADINIQKIDIVIDTGPGGATESLPNRFAGFQRWNAWDYAIVIDGWDKAVVPSLGQNTADSWNSNALTTDGDIKLLSDTERNTITALVSKEALGQPTAEDIRGWSIAVCMSSHDFAGPKDLGGTRWVNAERSEWNFGGGHRNNGENKDANLIDLLLIPGTGKLAGRPQEEILDYESDEAKERWENQQTAVAIEMSAFVDTGPPVISLASGYSVLTPTEEGSIRLQAAPITDAPLALALNIKDDSAVADALFRYRSNEYEGDGWDREVKMGFLGSDLWVVDIMPSWLDSNLTFSPIDGMRHLEFEVFAVDPYDKKVTKRYTDLTILPDATHRTQTATMDADDIHLLQLDGSQLSVPDPLRKRLVANHIAEAWQGSEVDPDTMGRFVDLVWEVGQAPAAITGAPTVPPGRPLGVFREVYLSTVDTAEVSLDLPGRLPHNFELALHYPQVWVPKGADEDQLALYRYHPASNRWVMAGGHVSPRGNTVTSTLGETGTFGLFFTESLGYTKGEVISGISISPNPFSPNRDGLYDETNLSFYLDRTASVTVEIYNIEGIRKKVLQATYEYAGDELDLGVPRRVPGIIWDGTDQNGIPVPYGIYIMRVIAKWGQPGNERYVRSNHSLAVIK